jgi:hypothetical protein
MTRKAATIWRAAARDQAPDAPSCPPDTSQPAWAILLFDGGCRCQVCKKKITFSETRLLNHVVCEGVRIN